MQKLLALNRILMCTFIFMLFLVIFVEISLRATANISLNFSWEVSCYLMAAVFFMGSADAFEKHEHIIIQIPLPITPKLDRMLRVFGMLIVLLALGCMLCAVVFDVWRDWGLDSQSFTKLQVPLYIPKLSLLMGTALAFVVVASRIFNRKKQLHD